MSTFDIRPDAPGMLRTESINITIKFERTGPATARISWNIPTPAPGCTSENQAYYGMVVTLDTKPASADKIPQRGEVYASDATADANLFAGDKLGSSLVIGAFYEDRTTTFFDITGLKPNTPYYVSGFPIDRQYRYFIEGVHAYSLDYTNRGTEGTHGSQVVVLNADAAQMGVDPDAYTGLHAGSDYDFTIQLGLDPKTQRPLDPVEPRYEAPRHTITVEGENAQTYTELVVAINRQLALLKNATQGPDAPNTDSYYFSASQKKLFQWNGSEHIEIPVIVQATQPNTVVTGTYWFHPTTLVLERWNGTAWVQATYISEVRDPTIPVADSSYWMSTTGAYEWNGTTWCELTTFVQDTDPSLGVEPPEGSFWYDDANGVLYRWNNALNLWTTTTAVQADANPSVPATGTYWFNDSTNQLYLYNAGWTLQSNVSISEVAPSAPAAGKLWYKPTTMQLFIRNVGNTAWDEGDVIVFHADPTVRESCDLWWEIDTDTMHVWNSLTSAWVAAAEFSIGPVDPSAAPVLSDGTAWYNDGVLSIWGNSCFTEVSYTDWPTDPRTTITDGTVWHNTTADTWFVRATGAWTSIAPVTSPTDPNLLATGTFWYNTGTTGLKTWNGATWVTVTYSSSLLTPAKGTLWYDTVAEVLKEWNGVAWATATPYATVELDAHSNLLFTDTTVGSSSYVSIVDGTLFKALELVFAIHNPKAGTDGASDEPMYSELGIGTDGNDAARNAIINDIRYELGYPVIDVELTKEQMDYAVDRALAELRSHSSLGYKRGFFFMSLRANEQKYFLTSKREKHNKIVDVIGCYRLTSAFLSSAHGAGVYGQIVLQHMYNMGSFDMLSYHLMSEYSSLLEILFAGRITFTWNEQTREIHLHNRFSQGETIVAIEATEERTEQDLMTDRYTKSWVRRYASAVCRLMLAEIRGKFSTLPGAGGSVTLNASEMRQSAKDEIDACMQDIEQYITDRPEEYGMGSSFIFG